MTFICFSYHYSTTQKLTLENQQLSNEHEKLKQEEEEKSARLQELMYVKFNKSNSKLTNDMINTKLATPKKIYTNKSNSSCKISNNKNWNDEKIIDHICDYYDELQYNYEYFNNNTDKSKNSNKNDENITDYLHSNFGGGDNKSTNCSNNFHNNTLNQYYQLTKIRKDFLNRKLIDHRERLKYDKIFKLNNNDKNLITSISSLVDSLTIPTFHFHLILSLTMVLLTHQCPQYLLVL